MENTKNKSKSLYETKNKLRRNIIHTASEQIVENQIKENEIFNKQIESKVEMRKKFKLEGMPGFKDGRPIIKESPNKENKEEIEFVPETLARKLFHKEYLDLTQDQKDKIDTEIEKNNKQETKNSKIKKEIKEDVEVQAVNMDTIKTEPTKEYVDHDGAKLKIGDTVIDGYGSEGEIIEFDAENNVVYKLLNTNTVRRSTSINLQNNREKSNGL